MAAALAIGGLDRPFCQGNTAFNEVLRAAALPAPASAFAFAARQIAPPTIIPGAGKLGIDEAVDRLVGDHLAALVTLKPTGDLLWRPAACEPLHDGGSQALLAFQTGALPASRPGLLLGVAGSVTHLRTAVAVQFPRDC